MTVVQCACGAKFDAKPHLAGKTMPCPKCGSALKIPLRRPTGSQDDRSIIVQCDCQKRFRARRELAGKRVACPSCQQPILVPMPSASSAVEPIEALQPEEASGLLDESFESPLPPAKKSSRVSSAQSGYYKIMAIVAVSIVLTSVVLIEVIQRIGGPGSSERVVSSSGELETMNTGSSSANDGTASVSREPSTACLLYTSPSPRDS